MAKKRQFRRVKRPSFAVGLSIVLIAILFLVGMWGNLEAVGEGKFGKRVLREPSGEKTGERAEKAAPVGDTVPVPDKKEDDAKTKQCTVFCLCTYSVEVRWKCSEDIDGTSGENDDGDFEEQTVTEAQRTRWNPTVNYYVNPNQAGSAIFDDGACTGETGYTDKNVFTVPEDEECPTKDDVCVNACTDALSKETGSRLNACVAHFAQECKNIDDDAEFTTPKLQNLIKGGLGS
jgi:hypothetical protein